MYCSDNKPIYQAEPKQMGKIGFKEWGWTSTIQGWYNESSKWRGCALKEKLQPWDVGINFEKDQTPSEIKDTWSKVGRNLRNKKVVALRIMEVTCDEQGKPLNRVHYHLIIKSKHTQRELETIIDNSIPEGIPFHKHVKKVAKMFGYVSYVFKCKVAGRVDGKWVADKWEYDRILFAPHCGFRKIATVGKFWSKPVEVTRTEIAKYEKQLAENLKGKDVRGFVKWLHDSKDIREMNFKKLRRHVGRNIDKPYMQSLLAKYRRYKANQNKQE